MRGARAAGRWRPGRADTLPFLAAGNWSHSAVDHHPRNAPGRQAELSHRAPDERPRRRHDQTCKRLFSHVAAVRSLVRHFAAKAWVHELDLSSLRPLPTESVGPDLARRLSDCVWRVLFKDGGGSVVFLFEFQSSPDAGMALRTLRYSEAVFSALHGNKELLDAAGAMPFVLPCVIYTGAKPWTAGTSLADLAGAPDLPPAAAQATAGWGTAHWHRRLDLQAFLAQDLAEDPLVGWLAALEREAWAGFPGVHRRMAEHWRGPDRLPERRALADWTAERMRAAGVPRKLRDEVAARIIQPKEEAEMGQTYQEWVEEHTQRGVEQGRQEGRAVVLRQVSRKFGAETAERLKGRVRTMGADQLALLGDAVVDCDTGDALLAAAEANGASRAS